MNFILNNGLKLPALGFGTYKASREAMSFAVEAGYRYFDTASFYGNEGVLGEVLRATGRPREEFIIASKVWKSDMGYEAALRAFSCTLDKLGTEYLDVYLIHWPQEGLDLETWRAMEELYRQGKVRALGLSNFLPYHAEKIITSCEVMPSVAQLEFHAGHMQTPAMLYYQSKGILVQAWSPAARGRVLDDELIVELAAKYHASPVQVCLSFCLHEGVMPLPKASSLPRMRENLESVNIELSAEDMMRLENIPPKGWSGEHPDRERVKIV